MKTEVAKAAPFFAPVVVTITLESAQEFKMFRKLAGKNTTVSRAVADVDVVSAADEQVLSDMLSNIFSVI